MTTGSDGRLRRRPPRPAARWLCLALIGGVAAAGSGCQSLPIAGEPPEQARKQPVQAREQPAETPPEPVVHQADNRQLAALLDYYRGVQMAPRSVLQERSEYLAAQVTAGECDPWRLKYAMVTKALTPPEDIARARELLAACLDTGRRNNRAVGKLALLLAELWESQAVSVRYQNQLQQTRQQLDREQAQSAKLREQLDGLKAIEQSIQQRDREKGASGGQ